MTVFLSRERFPNVLTSSLFTNIPVDETIDIISNQLFANCMYFEGFDRSQFTKLLFLAVKNCHFTFNDRIYQQIDGVAMGSTLGPLFGNSFMSFHEKSWLYNCPSAFKLLVYRRYVDDCFLLFKSSDHVPLFLNYLNHQHPNISFTILTFDLSFVPKHASPLSFLLRIKIPNF